MTHSPERSDSSSFVPMQAVIFDWAGTVCDFGSLAPVLALHKLFAAQGVPITSAQARGPMGRAKRDHIADILGLADVATRWQQVHGSRPGEAEIDRLFAQFLPMQLTELRERAQLIPGVLPMMAELRRRGLKVGSTTGYTAEMMAELRPLAAERGYVPDAVWTVSDVKKGRPAPWMAVRCAEQLGVWPLSAIVKVGDTVADVAEGLSAGMWTPDRDGDSIADAVDACPDKKGAPSVDPKKNGCPGLVVVESGQIVILKQVFFATNKDTILKQSYPVLDAVATALKAFPHLKKVRVEGHTDNVGKADYNTDLSDRRAKSVMAYLIVKGVEATRLDAKGFGPSKPIADNKMVKGRALNRRVDFVIVDPVLPEAKITLPEVPVGGKPAAKAGVGNKPAARAAGNKPAARAAGNKPAAQAPVK